MSAPARGIAEADSVDIAANAQAATPISNNRFMWEFPVLWRKRHRAKCPARS